MKKILFVISLGFIYASAISQETPAAYCIPSSTSAQTYITDFSTTGGIANIDNNGTIFSTGGYADYTTKSVSQYPGSTINFSMGFVAGAVNGSVQCKIWVDWNRDGVFSNPGEKVYDRISSNSPMISSFAVPAGTGVGDTRMRVTIDYYYGQTPCAFNSSGTRGEAEDYTLTVPVSSTTTYTFTGNGNWSDAANWLNNTMPPLVLDSGNQIIIDPVAAGECVLDVNQTVNTGAGITVSAGKSLRVPGNLTVQ